MGPRGRTRPGLDGAVTNGGHPVELGPVYVRLASQEASFITGEVYGVTGR